MIDPMDNTELKGACERLGWSGRELGRKTGYTPQTINSYMHGRAEVPPLLAEYLRFRLNVQRVIDGLQAILYVR